MPLMFFLPWLVLDKPRTVGSVEMHPFSVGHTPGDLGGLTQEMFDGVLSNYSDRAILSADGAPRSLQRATILRWPEDHITSEIPDSEVFRRLNIGQYLAFGALANRHFGWHLDYCNADELRLVAQRFDPAKPKTVVISERRRDGGSSHHIPQSGTSPIFLRPHHVQSGKKDIDYLLVDALVATENSELRVRLHDAITVFNRANTDATEVPQTVEVVLLQVAFETLLGASHTSESLQAAFNNHFESELPKPHVWPQGELNEKVWRAVHPKHVYRPLDAWVQDFCAVRNMSAHGTSAPRKWPDPVWSIRNHLLFASWLFPLMVKKALADEDAYRLSDDDIDRRSGIELFLSHDLFAEGKDGQIKWMEVEEAFLERRLERTIREALQKHEFLTPHRG